MKTNFGSIIRTITISAADYIVSGELPNEAKKFREHFVLLNNKEFDLWLNLKFSSDVLFVGQCGFNRQNNAILKEKEIEEIE